MRRVQGLVLTVVVLLLHLWLAERHWPMRLGEGHSDADTDTRPRRIEVSFVRQLQQTAPPMAPPVRKPAWRRLAALAPEPAASAAEAAEPSLLSPADQLLQAPDPVPPLPALAQLAEPLPESPPVPMPVPDTFEWPPSTRLSYTLTGNYRGPVEGQAQVEWLRAGNRYQVHLDVSVGPFFAPLLSRRITSEGTLTAEGLRPQRYDEETRMALREPRRLTIWLDDETVRLPGGTQPPRPPDVQDSASQFVQLTWLFTTRPQWLQAGRVIELPLALPRRVAPWRYEVMQTETLFTPAGEVQAVHVKPQRHPGVPGVLAGELAAEFWVAPSLQYLPVRILIRQDADTYVDLLIERLPQQAQPGR